ncbi:DUF3405 domain-containing protein [Flavobacterium daejeonense]|uniref:DUF3405 domain-containing protein n=1 Tax=Flavobacterium daejeonense TaxID=350893 RepID=UPI0004789418|nr:DUF3405 domain-containing protein [Flavobacterium daejeonense]
MKQAFLLLSCHLSNAVINSFNEIVTATNSEKNITCLLYHQKGDNLQKQISNNDVFYFSDDILTNLNYKPLGEKLIPGNNHFPLLKFYKENPDYDYYWCIEDDVRYTGNWAHFFEYFEKFDKSFISSHIQRFTDDPHWPWWRTLLYNGKTLETEYLIRSFNPIYRISKEALSFIDQELLNGWQGHHEVLFPTLLNAAGADLMDFGGKGEFVSPGDENKFYLGNYTQNSHLENRESTFKWRPVLEKMGDIPNKLYHPVKD